MLRHLVLAALVAATPGLAAAEPFRATVARQVAACWTISTLSPEAQATTVTLGVELGPDAVPHTEAITLIASDAPAAAAQEAFEAARRAVLRCALQRDGYSLPPEKYARWRETIIDFRPQGGPSIR